MAKSHIPTKTSKQRSIPKGSSASGNVNTVLREEACIYRPTGPWSPAVHLLLQHLERQDFSLAPAFLGTDGTKEKLSYFEGEVALRPWPPVLFQEEGLQQITSFLRSYHQAAKTFVPPSHAVWRNPLYSWKPENIIIHGDLGPWNTVWSQGKLIGAIDWDFARPGEPIEQIAQVAWYFLPLRNEKAWCQAGFSSKPDLSRRLRTFAGWLEISPTEIYEATIHLLEKEMLHIQELGRKGLEPWQSFLKRGDVHEMQCEQSWLLRHKTSLLS